MIQDLTGSWCIKGTDESTLVMDSPVPLMHHDPDRSWITDPDPEHPKRNAAINKSLHLSMLHVHDTFNPGLAVRQASHMDSDCSIDNCVTFINGPVLMTLKLKYNTLLTRNPIGNRAISVSVDKNLYQNNIKYINILFP